MSLEKLLEETPEEGWVAIETTQETVRGRLETTREYTATQRDELKQNIEYFGRANYNTEDSHLPRIEPEGEIITATLHNHFQDYQVEINPMSSVTHVTQKHGNGSQTHLTPEKAYLEQQETVLNKYNRQINLNYLEEQPEDTEPAKIAQ